MSRASQCCYPMLCRDPVICRVLCCSRIAHPRKHPHIHFPTLASPPCRWRVAIGGRAAASLTVAEGHASGHASKRLRPFTRHTPLTRVICCLLHFCLIITTRCFGVADSWRPLASWLCSQAFSSDRPLSIRWAMAPLSKLVIESRELATIKPITGQHPCPLVDLSCATAGD